MKMESRPLYSHAVLSFSRPFGVLALVIEFIPSLGAVARPGSLLHDSTHTRAERLAG